MTNKPKAPKSKATQKAPSEAGIEPIAIVDERLLLMQQYLNDATTQLDRIEASVAQFNQKLERLMEISGY